MVLGNVIKKFERETLKGESVPPTCSEQLFIDRKSLSILVGWGNAMTIKGHGSYLTAQQATPLFHSSSSFHPSHSK